MNGWLHNHIKLKGIGYEVKVSAESMQGHLPERPVDGTPFSDGTLDKLSAHKREEDRVPSPDRGGL